MTRTRTALLAAALAAVPAAVAAIPAAAAPPANDDRTAPAALQVPGRVTGTLAEATRDQADPSPGCGPQPGPSVWYRLDGLSPGRVALQLAAAEGSGTAVAVYRRDGGDLVNEICDATDRAGDAGVFFTAGRGERYVVEVVAGVRADAGAFTLQAFRPDAPPRLPAPPLPARGASATVDVIRDPEDAYSVRMTPGVTYRVNLAAGAAGSCRVGLSILGPGASLDSEAVAVRRCGGYLTYTPGPGQGGLHTLLVEANPGVRSPRYRLTAGPVGPDDQAPGRGLPLGRRVSGVVSGTGLDRLDVFSFDVTSRSQVRLRLSTGGGIDLRLLTPTGRLVGCGCGDEGGGEVLRALFPGRYLAVVRAQDGSGGRYRLLRTARVITTARTTVQGARTATIAAGSTASVALAVSPAPSGGRAVIDAEQFDPLSGWQFRRRFTATVSGGAARVAFTPGPGRWRFRGSYRGTSSSAASEGGTAVLTVTSRVP